ncbi:MAG: hypothetical protein WC762_02960 [Methylobacter sp.]|jgi:hypothetical protein
MTAKQTQPSIYITRAEILEHTAASRVKLQKVVAIKSLVFPKPAKTMANNEIAYLRAEVMPWLDKNNLKTMELPEQPTEQAKAGKPPKIDNAAANAFLTGRINKPTTKTKHRPKTVVIHLIERHPEQPPHPQLSRFSNSGDHRLALAVDIY